MTSMTFFKGYVSGYSSGIVIEQFSKSKRHFGVVVLSKLLYLLGGETLQQIAGKYEWTVTSSVEMYDPLLNRWHNDIQPMNIPKCDVGAGSIGECIYVVGGLHDGNSTNTVEKYNTKRNKWTKVSSMKYCRNGMGVSTLNGYLYVVGGYNTNTSRTLNNVERYDPMTNMWTEVSAMNTTRSWFGCSTYRGMIYVVSHINSHEKIFETYNPETDSWNLRKVTGSESDFNVSLVVFNNQLIHIATMINDDEIFISEVYDPDLNTLNRNHQITLEIKEKDYVQSNYNNMNFCVINFS